LANSSEIFESGSLNHRFESILEPKCDLFSRIRSTENTGEEKIGFGKPTVLTGILASDLPPKPWIGVVRGGPHAVDLKGTCPFELLVSAEDNSWVQSTNSGAISACLNTWIIAKEVLASQKSRLNMAQQWARRKFEGLENWVRVSAKSVGNVAFSEIAPMVSRSIAKRVPITRVSHVKSVSEDFAPEAIFEIETTPKTAVKLSIEPIQDEGSTDSYWQYYEDCDRWGVNFAILLIEADRPISISNGSPLPPENDARLSKKDAVYSPISAIGLLMAQRLARFPSEVSEYTNQISQYLRESLNFCEFQYIEMKGIDFEPLDVDFSTRFSSGLMALRHRREPLGGIQNLFKTVACPESSGDQMRVLSHTQRLLKTLACPQFGKETLACPPFLVYSADFVKTVKTAQKRLIQGLAMVHRTITSAPRSMFETPGNQLANRTRTVIQQYVALVDSVSWFSPNEKESLANVVTDLQH
jgi:hypothetical protein